MNTNFYTSIHTNNLTLDKLNRSQRALAILSGKKNGMRTRQKDMYVPQSHSPYVTYGRMNMTAAITKQETGILDNSGPCTANSKVDASINLDAYICAARTKNAAAIAASGDEFTFHTLENYESVGDAYYNALVEKYTFLHKEAIQHADPEKYIEDKYHNPDSPYYEAELTWYERDIAFRYEKQMLNTGKISGVHFQDSLFREKPVNGLQSNGDERRYNRKVMNQQLSNMLQNNNITIPEGVTLRCTIDPTTCFIRIKDVTNDGINREALCEKIERAINVRENGLNLYQHIMQSSYSAVQIGSTQYNYEGRIKFQYRHNTDGTSLGMSGDYNQKFKDYCKKYYPAYADKAEEVGFDGFLDMYLSIDITAKGFEDVCQDVNWCDDADATILEWQKKSVYSTL